MEKEERIKEVVNVLTEMGACESEAQARTKAEEIVATVPERKDDADQKISDATAAISRAAEETQAAVEKQARELEEKATNALKDTEEHKKSQ